MKSRKSFRILFPKLQGRLLMLMLLCSATSVVLSACLTMMAMSSVSSGLPHDGDLMLREVPNVLGIQMLVGFALALPAFALIGSLASMPMFGALYRIQQYLEQVENGEETKALFLRDKDPLQGLSSLVSRATEDQRDRNEEALKREEDADANSASKAEPSKASAATEDASKEADESASDDAKDKDQAA